MYKFVEKLSKELEECGRIPSFEIEVIDGAGKEGFINCDIFFKGNSLIAERDAVSIKEQRSKYIANSRTVCDSSFSLDEHLQALFDKVIEDIQEGDLYTLVD